MNELHINDKIWIVFIEEKSIIISTNQQPQLKCATWTNNKLEIEQAINLAIVENPNTKNIVVLEDTIKEIKEKEFITVQDYCCNY